MVNDLVAPDGSILFDAACCATGDGIAFDVWYGQHHLPALRARLSNAQATVYASATYRNLTAIFELPSGLRVEQALAAAAEPNPVADRWEQFVAAPLTRSKRPDAEDWARLARAPIAYPVFFGVPPSREEEFNRWYDEEHIAILLGCEQWLACRRFRLLTPHPDGYTHLALHYLADLRALQSPQRDRARRTPWRDSLATESWFRGEYRVCYRWGFR